MIALTAAHIEADEASMTVGQCLAAGHVTRAEIDAALRDFLANSDPFLAAPGIFACLPPFDELPSRLRLALVELALLARV